VRFEHAHCRWRVRGELARRSWVRVPYDVKKKIPDKAAAARSIQAMLERPAQRLIVGHADVIGSDCRDTLARAWRLEGVEV
jgi:hypothetical protein